MKNILLYIVDLAAYQLIYVTVETGGRNFSLPFSAKGNVDINQQTWPWETFHLYDAISLELLFV